MKKIALFILLCLVVVLVAMSPIVPAQQSNRTQTASHDIKAVLEGTLTFVPLPFTSDFPFPFDVGTLSVASAQVKGLGNSNVFTFHHPGPPPSATEPSVVLDGRFFIVAANGDKIQGTYEGTTEPGTKPDQLIGRAEWVITGGTGRFANASGTITATAYITVAGFDVFEWPVTWVLEGTIIY